MKALVIKRWCEENVSPLAWKRIVLKVMDMAAEEGYSVSDLQHPNDKVMISKRMQHRVNDILMQLYRKQYAYA